MNAEQFVDRVVQSVTDIAGLPRLRLVFAELITHENVVLMGKGALNYSRHRNNKTKSYSSKVLFSCGTDHTEHKNHC